MGKPPMRVFTLRILELTDKHVHLFLFILDSKSLFITTILQIICIFTSGWMTSSVDANPKYSHGTLQLSLKLGCFCEANPISWHCNLLFNYHKYHISHRHVGQLVAHIHLRRHSKPDCVCPTKSRIIQLIYARFRCANETHAYVGKFAGAHPFEPE